jgi:hypothetical protein
MVWAKVSRTTRFSASNTKNKATTMVNMEGAAAQSLQRQQQTITTTTISSNQPQHK